MGIAEEQLLHARCPFYHSANSIKASYILVVHLAAAVDRGFYPPNSRMLIKLKLPLPRIFLSTARSLPSSVSSPNRPSCPTVWAAFVLKAVLLEITIYTVYSLDITSA